MALGLTRRTRAHPVDLETLAYAAHEFREALIPRRGITPDRCDAAVMRYRYGHEVFARAEDLGADMLAQLATHRRPSLPALTELCDVCTHARTLDHHQRPEMFGAIARRATRRLRTAPGDSAGADNDRATGRSCIVDQAELRWRIRRDLTSLVFENVLAGDGISREAERHLVPWLKLACETLDSPMSIDGLEDVAAQWRERRRPYMAFYRTKMGGRSANSRRVYVRGKNRRGSALDGGGPPPTRSVPTTGPPPEGTGIGCHCAPLLTCGRGRRAVWVQRARAPVSGRISRMTSIGGYQTSPISRTVTRAWSSRFTVAAELPRRLLSSPGSWWT